MSSFVRRTGQVERQLRIALLRIAIGALPESALRPCLDHAVGLVARRHGAMLMRLSAYAGRSFLIDPVDVPRFFLLDLAKPSGMPRLRVAMARDRVTAVAALRGPLASLLDLLEGRADGDALFFARDLSIEGDTGAIVALRNALDGEEIDLLDDLLGALGPFAGAARQAAAAAERLAGHVLQEAERLRALLLAPVLGRCDEMACELRSLRREIAASTGRPTARPEKIRPIAGTTMAES